MMGLTQIPYIWFYESAIICKFDQIWKRPYLIKFTNDRAFIEPYIGNPRQSHHSRKSSF